MPHYLTRTAQKILYSFGFQVIKAKKTAFYLNENWLKKLNILNVIDIGANTGQFAVAANKVMKSLNIISFEPIKQCYDELVRNTSGMNITCYNYALSDEVNLGKINVSSNLVSSSILGMEAHHENLYPESKYYKQEEIKMTRLDDIISGHELKGNSLVKIDVQGFEEKVVKGGTKTLAVATVVIVETSFTPMYENQWLFDDVYNFFVKSDFVFLGMIDQATDKFSKIPIYGDAIFIKKDLAGICFERN